MRGTIGNNNSDLTEMNRSALVKILQQRGICSRADIAKHMGLTQASITKIVAALMEMGIVSEVGSIKGHGNRRSIGLKLNADKYQVIGVKFSRHMFAVGVFDISGKIYAQNEIEYPPGQDQKTALDSMKKQIHQTLEDYKNVAAICLAVPGPYLQDVGRITVVTQMPAWHNISFVEEFKDEFDKPFFTVHDANAGAMAEWLFGGHPRPLHTLAYFLVGEGVGSGIIENGSLLLGTQGAASEIGHISVDVNGPRCECGNYGCLEMYCSAPAMVKLARRIAPECLTGDRRQNADACRAIFEAARSGDAKAMEVVRKVAKYIGCGCVTLINAYNPDIIVIGDTVAQGGDLLLPLIQEVVKERAISELYARVQIKISGLKADPTLYGAAAMATDKLLQMPSAFLAGRE